MNVGDIVEALIESKPYAYGIWLRLEKYRILCDAGDEQPDFDSFRPGDKVRVKILRINGDAISGRLLGS